MKRLLFATALCSGLLLSSVSMFAQDRDDHDRHEGGDRFYGGRLFERVRADLDRVEDRTWPMTEDRHRVQRAKEELNKLQGKLDRHDFVPHELNEVIETMQWVVKGNHLRPRDRDALQDDLVRLREFRERHEEWRERR